MHALRLVPPALLLPLLLLSANASAGKLYQWKDARGVTHYSDSPPPANAYKQRYIDNPDPVPGAAQPATGTPAAQPATPSACDQARANLAALQDSGPVGLDANHDGVPDSTLDDAGRAEQQRKAQAVISRTCNAPAAPPAGQ
jgi:hypothetical protein